MTTGDSFTHAIRAKAQPIWDRELPQRLSTYPSQIRLELGFAFGFLVEQKGLPVVFLSEKVSSDISELVSPNVGAAGSYVTAVSMIFIGVWWFP